MKHFIKKGLFFPLTKLGTGLFDLIAVFEVLPSESRELTPFWQAFLNTDCTV